MKICIVTGIFPPDIGGPATYLSHLTRALAEAGHDVRVVTWSDAPRRVREPVRIYPILRTQDKILRFLQTLVSIFEAARGCDRMFVNGLEFPAVLANFILRKPMVMKIVGDYAWEYSRNNGLVKEGIDEFQKRKYPWKVRLLKTVRTFYVSGAHRVIVPSRYLKTLVEGWGIPPSRIRVVHNAPRPMEPKSVQPIHLPGFTDRYRKIVISVGRLTNWKGMDLLIRVVADRPDLGLLVVGDGPERERLIGLSRSWELQHRVHFTGKVDQDQVDRYLAASHVLVLNTGYEGMSHTILESMRMGVPVITTDLCGNPELIRHNEDGLLVPWNDPERLGSALDRVLSDEGFRRGLIKNAQERLKQFSWDRLLRETFEVLT
jgi:glycosyltransferase involved in cell wall biosynthesis